jgi:hypothetical protein
MAKQPKNNKTFVVEDLALDKETKNTFRFQADPSEAIPAFIETLYISKRAFGKVKPGKVKKITVEWEEE